jgi:hypothetical protein
MAKPNYLTVTQWTIKKIFEELPSRVTHERPKVSFHRKTNIFSFPDGL